MASVWTIFLFGLAVAHADGGAPPTTPSDYTGKEIKIDTDYGEIETKAHEFKVETGGYSGTDGKGVTLKAKYVNPAYIGKTSKEGAGGLLLDPNLNVEVKYNPDTKDTSKVDIKAGEVAIAGTYVNYPYSGSTYGSATKPNATAQMLILPVNGVYKDDKTLGVSSKGVAIGNFFPFANTSGHVAVNIAGVNTDFCYSLEVGKLLLGEQKIGTAKSKIGWQLVDASACVGVTLGEKVGHVYDLAKVSYIGLPTEADDHSKGNADVVEFSNTAGVDKIGGTGFGANYTFTTGHSSDGTGNDKYYKEHMVKVGYAF